MKPNVIHSIVVCLVAFALPFMVACSSQEESLLDVDGQMTMLFLDIEPLGQTKAAGDDALGNERIHSLRVVILHQDGTVEHNRYYYDESAGGVRQKSILLPVKSNETKKIFLFANEESVTTVEGVTPGPTLSAFLESYPAEGSRKDFATEVNKLYFSMDYASDTDIPMSSMYEITDALEPGKRVDKDCYVVRVATKFDVTITNNRSQSVRIKGFKVCSIADEQYLFPHFTREGIITKTEGKKGFDFGTQTGLSWIDWLAKTSDESQSYPDAPKADERGWIMEYMVPTSQENHKPVTWDLSKTANDIAVNGTLTLPTQYCPESRNVCKIEPFCKAAKDIEQQYKVEIRLNDGSKDCTFTEVLPNLRALFRNTHVKIDITLGENGITWRICVRPWHLVGHAQIIL